MKTSHQIAIIGGTGTAGRYLAQKALESGHRVRMLVRNPEKLTYHDNRIQITVGDARDVSSIRSLLEGCNVVINTFGQPVKALPLYSEITSNVLAVMSEYGIRRYIGVTGGSLNVDGDRKSLINRVASKWFEILLRKMIIDKKKELALLMKSDIEWTLVRLPIVVEGSGTGIMKENLTDVPGRTMTNEDIAKFLISQIDDKKYVRKTPCISN
ncbi:Putative NADH-flavin reductase [Paenibacillus sophorae]|uniref:NAD(P)H-binding protein n=1 Tax=Paenibacillus sophorae TaxID=1333845 RepID=A0A1H8IWM7_9BACL|nr:NAD(P)H-binding protein [Paenibacillus sophorae]QWU16084.1 NAD(P)H-binding protein [Paenibacillus sophorae]SEN72098.1 Putative NADH-flavin reductase [Paenibacillus sophorae]